SRRNRTLESYLFCRCGELSRRGLMASEEAARPVLQPIDLVVINVFWRTANEEPIADFFFVLILRPAIARLAKGNFVPLPSLVIIAHFCEGLAIPHAADPIFEDVSHIRGSQPVEAAQPHTTVVVDRHSLVDYWTRDASAGRCHLWKGAILEHNSHPHHVDHSDPARDECFLF